MINANTGPNVITGCGVNNPNIKLLWLDKIGNLTKPSLGTKHDGYGMAPQ